jgi:hypothetical protein
MQRLAGRAGGAAACRHETPLRVGCAERAILGLSVSDEDDCHDPSIDRSNARAETMHLRW